MKLSNFKSKFQTVAEKTAKNFRVLLFAAPCRSANEVNFCGHS